MSAQHSEKASTVLSKVASLTSIRDVELFEISFLNTLIEMLQVKEICIFKRNHFDNACHLLRYVSKNGACIDINSNSVDIQFEETDLPDELLDAQNWIEKTHKIYSIPLDNLYFMVYPIIGLKGTVGYLSLYLKEKLSEIENNLVSSLLSISQNFYSLLEENQKDKLTGLLNRKTLEQNISKIQAILNTENQDNLFAGIEKRSTGQGKEFWLAILDIDHFKRINDQFGHIYGDEVLLLLSQIMKHTFRTQDLLFRFGGEEFITILQTNNQLETEQVLERFRIAIGQFDFPRIKKVTVSIGATKINKIPSISSEIVGRADLALYHAKENGRNKLYFYEDLISAGVLTRHEPENSAEVF